MFARLEKRVKQNPKPVVISSFMIRPHLFVEQFRQSVEHAPCGGSFFGIHRRKQPLDRMFDRPRHGFVEGPTLGRQTQRHPPFVAVILTPLQQPFAFEPSQRCRYGSRVEMQQRSKLPRRHTGVFPDTPNDEPLLSRNAERRFHPQRSALQGVIEPPHALQEFEHRRQRKAFRLFVLLHGYRPFARNSTSVSKSKSISS